jgi:hypothetical protein
MQFHLKYLWILQSLTLSITHFTFFVQGASNDSAASGVSSSLWGLVSSLQSVGSSLIQSTKADLAEFKHSLSSETQEIIKEREETRAKRAAAASNESGNNNDKSAISAENLAALSDQLEKLGDKVWETTASLLPSVLGTTNASIHNNKPSGRTVTKANSASKSPPASSIAAALTFQQKLSQFQQNSVTYSQDPLDLVSFQEFSSQFNLESYRNEINLLKNDNSGAVKQFYEEFVEHQGTEERSFWARYFFGRNQLEQEEERRKKLADRLKAVDSSVNTNHGKQSANSAPNGPEEDDLTWEDDNTTESNNNNNNDNNNINNNDNNNINNNKAASAATISPAIGAEVITAPKPPTIIENYSPSPAAAAIEPEEIRSTANAHSSQITQSSSNPPAAELKSTEIAPTKPNLSHTSISVVSPALHQSQTVSTQSTEPSTTQNTPIKSLAPSNSMPSKAVSDREAIIKAAEERKKAKLLAAQQQQQPPQPQSQPQLLVVDQSEKVETSLLSAQRRAMAAASITQTPAFADEERQTAATSVTTNTVAKSSSVADSLLDDWAEWE